MRRNHMGGAACSKCKKFESFLTVFPDFDVVLVVIQMMISSVLWCFETFWLQWPFKLSVKAVYICRRVLLTYCSCKHVVHEGTETPPVHGLPVTAPGQDLRGPATTTQHHPPLTVTKKGGVPKLGSTVSYSGTRAQLSSAISY